MAWTAPKTWAVNDILTAADLNTYTRDNELAIGTWTTYTPTWTATTTNPAVGNGTIIGRYLATSDWVDLWIALVPGSTSTFGSGQYFLSLPFAAVGTYEQFLDASLYNAGVSRHRGVAFIAASASTISIYEPVAWGVASGPGIWNTTSPFTFGSGDVVTIFGKYRRV